MKLIKEHAKAKDKSDKRNKPLDHFSNVEFKSWCSKHKYADILLEVFSGKSYMEIAKMKRQQVIKMLLMRFAAISQSIYDDINQLIILLEDHPSSSEGQGKEKINTQMEEEKRQRDQKKKNCKKDTSASTFQLKPTDKKWDLSGKSIGERDCSIISRFLMINSTLKELHLYRNQIGNKGAEAIAESLKNNSTMTHINLSLNSIGDIGAQGLANGLKNNSSLIYLNVGFNSIGDIGAQSFANALKINTTIKSMNLYANKIGDNQKNILRAVKKDHLSLSRLYLVNCLKPE